MVSSKQRRHLDRSWGHAEVREDADVLANLCDVYKEGTIGVVSRGMVLAMLVKGRDGGSIARTQQDPSSGSGLGALPTKDTGIAAKSLLRCAPPEIKGDGW